MPVNETFNTSELCFEFNWGTCCCKFCFRYVIFPEKLTSVYNDIRNNCSCMCICTNGDCVTRRYAGFSSCGKFFIHNFSFHWWTHGGSPWKETDALPLVPAAACVSESVWLHRKMIFNREDARFVEKLFYN